MVGDTRAGRPPADRGEVIARYALETRKLKVVFVLIALLLIPAVAISFIVGTGDWRIVLLMTAIIPTALFAFIWLYGTAAMFGHEWHITTCGVVELRKGREKKFIGWSDVRMLASWQAIVSRDWRAISFKLPPETAAEALRAVKDEWRRRSPDAAETFEEAMKGMCLFRIALALAGIVPSLGVPLLLSLGVAFGLGAMKGLGYIGWSQGTIILISALVFSACGGSILWMLDKTRIFDRLVWKIGACRAARRKQTG